MQRLAIPSFLALFLGGSGTLPAQPAFIRSDVIVGFGPQAVVTGDFNGDHNPDRPSSRRRSLHHLNRGYTDLPAPRPIRTEGLSGSDLHHELLCPVCRGCGF